MTDLNDKINSARVANKDSSSILFSPYSKLREDTLANSKIALEEKILSAKLISAGAKKNIQEATNEYRAILLPWKRWAKLKEIAAYQELFVESDLALIQRQKLAVNLDENNFQTIKVKNINVPATQKKLSEIGKRLTTQAVFLDNTEATGRWIAYGLVGVAVGAAVGILALKSCALLGLVTIASSGSLSSISFSAYLISSITGSGLGFLGGLFSYGILAAAENLVQVKYYGNKTWEQGLSEISETAIRGAKEQGLLGIGLGFAGVFSRLFAGISTSLLKQLTNWSIQGASASFINSPVGLWLRYQEASNYYKNHCQEKGVLKDPEAWQKIAKEIKISPWELPKDVASAALSGIIGGKSDFLRNITPSLRKQIGIDAVEFFSTSTLGIARAFYETEDWSYKNIGQAATQEIVSNTTSALRTHSTIAPGLFTKKLKTVFSKAPKQDVILPTAAEPLLLPQAEIIDETTQLKESPDKPWKTTRQIEDLTRKDIDYLMEYLLKHQLATVGDNVLRIGYNNIKFICLKHLENNGKFNGILEASVKYEQNQFEPVLSLNYVHAQSRLGVARILRAFAERYYEDFMKTGLNCPIVYSCSVDEAKLLLPGFLKRLAILSKGEFDFEVIPKDIEQQIIPSPRLPLIIRPIPKKSETSSTSPPRINPISGLSDDFMAQIVTLLIEDLRYVRHLDDISCIIKDRPLKTYDQMFPEDTTPKTTRQITTKAELDTLITDLNQLATQWQVLKKTTIGQVKAVSRFVDNVLQIDAHFSEILKKVNFKAVFYRKHFDHNGGVPELFDIDYVARFKRRQMLSLKAHPPRIEKDDRLSYAKFKSYEEHLALHEELLQTFPHELRELLSGYCFTDIWNIHETDVRYENIDNAAAYKSAAAKTCARQLLITAKWRTLSQILELSAEGVLQIKKEFQEIIEDFDGMKLSIKNKGIFNLLNTFPDDSSWSLKHSFFLGVLSPKALRSYQKIMELKETKSHLEGLSLGAASCLKIFLYTRLTEVKQGRAIADFTLAAQKTRAEELQMQKVGMPSIGIELHLPVIEEHHKTLTYCYKAALTFFNIWSPHKESLGKTVEASLLPTYSFHAYRLGMESILKLGMLGDKVCTIGLHFNIAGDYLSRELESYLAIPLHIPSPYSPFPAAAVYREIYSDPKRRNLVLENLFTKGLVKGRTMSLDPFGIPTAVEKPTIEIRSGRLNNRRDNPRELDTYYQKLLPAIWYLARTLPETRGTNRNIELAIIGDQYCQAFIDILTDSRFCLDGEDAVKKYFLGNWQENTKLTTFENLEMPKRLAAFWKLIAENPALHQDLYDRIMGCVLRHANAIAKVLEIPEV